MISPAEITSASTPSVSSIRTDGDRLAGHERFRGWGVMSLPFDSGHVLGLRVMPVNDYAPFVAVWHRTPEGAWSMYVDGSHPEVFCPRLFGPILVESGPANIRVSWRDEHTVRVLMEEPTMEWTVRLASTPLTRVMNVVLPRIPIGLYRRRPVLSTMVAVSRTLLGLGTMDLAGEVPGGQQVLVRPDRIDLVDDSRATFDGIQLGRPAPAEENPRTGAFRWPARGIVARGEVHVAIDDPERYRRRLALFATGPASTAGTQPTDESTRTGNSD